MMNLGIPKNRELTGRNDVVYVHEYTRSDGTVVSAHYRSKPDNANISNKVITGNDYLQGAINDTIGLNNPKDIFYQTLGIFLTNYNNMKKANTIGADKYFHAKANFEAAQQGLVGSMFAKIISDLRELSDNYRNINEKGYTLEESLKDINEDLKANQVGRDLGRLYPNDNSYQILEQMMLKGLPDRYKK